MIFENSASTIFSSKINTSFENFTKLLSNHFNNSQSFYQKSYEINLEVKLENIKIINYQDRKKELFEIRFVNNNLIVEIKFGISRSYKNFVSFDLQNKESYQFKPFFYGRPGKRIIKYKKGEKVEIKKIDESNSFETLFKQQPSVWINSQEKRNKVVRKKLTDLEYIWKIYKNYNK